MFSDFFQAVVIITCIFYISNKFGEIHSKLSRNKIAGIFEKINSLEDRSMRDIGTNFELWWAESGSQSALKYIRNNLSNQIGESIPQEMKEFILESHMVSHMAGDIKSDTLKYAAHLHSTKERLSLIESIPAKYTDIHEQIEEAESHLAEQINKLETALIECGIDIESLAKEFSSN